MKNITLTLRAECRLFVSEDMQDGASIEGMRITNPFKPEFSRLLGRM